MALFGKKKEGDTATADTKDTPAGEGGFSPDNARKFFDRAKHAHDTLNYSYAVQLWLNGLRWDPASEAGFEGFKGSAALLAAEDKKPNAKEIAKGLQGQGKILKFQNALLAWGLKMDDPGLALKAAEAAGDLGVRGITEQLGGLALRIARADKKQRKDVYVRLMDAFETAEAFNLAVEAGEEARRLDPSDGELAKHVQQLSAESAIHRGGFAEGAGQEGGFRKNIRDTTKQTQLEAEDRLTKTEDVKDRILAAAEEEFKARPDDAPTIEKYGRALVDRGKTPDLLKAITLYTKAYKETGQFRFRERSGEVQLTQMQKSVTALKAKLAAAPENEELKAKVEDAEKQLAAKRLEELRLQVENYPTDLRRKFMLAQILYNTGEYQEAIGLLQLAQDDPKIRPAVLRYLAQSFLALGGWEDAAIETFRRALGDVADDTSDTAMELKYGLMCALQEKGSKDRDLDAAEEADRLAGGIAMKNFGYKDIQDRRPQIKSLIQELRS